MTSVNIVLVSGLLGSGKRRLAQHIVNDVDGVLFDLNLSSFELLEERAAAILHTHSHACGDGCDHDHGDHEEAPGGDKCCGGGACDCGPDGCGDPDCCAHPTSGHDHTTKEEEDACDVCGELPSPNEKTFDLIEVLSAQTKDTTIVVMCHEILDPANVAFAIDVLTNASMERPYQATIAFCVTAIDGNLYLQHLYEARELADLKIDEDLLPGATSTDLAIQSIEFADSIVVTGSPSLSTEERNELDETLAILNPRAQVLFTDEHFFETPYNQLSERPFGGEETLAGAGWQLAARAFAESEGHVTGEHLTIFRSRAPFDGEMLWKMLHADTTWESVLRSRGVFWVNTAPTICYDWDQTAAVSAVSPAGVWPESGEEAEALEDWDEVYGARHNEIVFLGTELDSEFLVERFTACLVKDWSPDDEVGEHPFPV